MKLQITNTETFEDNAEIVDIYGQGCNYATKQGVDGFQVDFTVKAGERSFNVIFQTDERTDNIMAYNGYEMTEAERFGCDADQSSELREYCEYSDDCETFLFMLNEKAEALCKEWFLNITGSDSE